VLERGGVIGGSSAGASIQASYMVRGNPMGNVDPMADGYETGLGFITGVAVDQHFTQRGRLPDMTEVMDRHPQLLGIGLDEAARQAVRETIAHVCRRTSLAPHEAYMLCSLAGDLHVTQTVDGVKGCHMMLAKSHL